MSYPRDRQEVLPPQRTRGDGGCSVAIDDDDENEIPPFALGAHEELRLSGGGSADDECQVEELQPPDLADTLVSEMSAVDSAMLSATMLSGDQRVDMGGEGGSVMAAAADFSLEVTEGLTARPAELSATLDISAVALSDGPHKEDDEEGGAIILPAAESEEDQTASSTSASSGIRSTIGTTSLTHESTMRASADETPQNALLGNNSSVTDLGWVAGSVGFSQLMREADDTVQQKSAASGALGPVAEERDDSRNDSSSAATPMTSNCSGRATKAKTNTAWGGWFGGLLWSNPTERGEESSHGTLSTGTAGNMQLTSLSSSSPSRPRRENWTDEWIQTPRENDETVSTRRAPKGVKGTQTGPKSFRVWMNVGQSCTVRDVVDVLGNVELLRVWYDPVGTVYVVRGGNEEGDRRDGAGGGNEDREYDGEWIEATTTTLTAPQTSTSQIFGMATTTMTYLGFPTHGRITMFLERNRGRVGLTVGPFDGGVVISHTFTVHETTEEVEVSEDGAVVVGGGVTVVDDVRLGAEDDENGEDEFVKWVCKCCGLSDGVKSCLLPTVGMYMEQCLKSMGQLRSLVENGGEVGAYVVSGGGGGSDAVDVPLLG